jgi:hypothetical protein
MGQLLALKDVKSGVTEYLDQATAKVYADAEGARLLRQLEETEYLLGEKGKPVLDKGGRMIHVSKLANAAASHYYTEMACQLGHEVPWQMRDEGGTLVDMTATPTGRRFKLRDPGTGRMVKMDLGVSDVHTAAALPNYAGGYHIGEGCADVASPVVLVPKAQDVYYTYSSDSDFKRKIANAGAPGSGVGEVNPALSPSTFTTEQYVLGGFIPTEIQANADTPLRPITKMLQMIVDGLRLEREYRVAAALDLSSNWTSSLVTTIAAGSQWNGVASSDPIANLHNLIEQSYMPVTALVWSERVRHDFTRNPAVQKYFYPKDGVKSIPSNQMISEEFDLPPIYTASMKYVVGSTLSYVWGNTVVGLRQPPQLPPVDQMDVATSLTFRWMGGEAPDGTVTAGFLVRQYYDPKRGARGGTMAVVVHSDAEVITSGKVGGLIISAHQ